MKSAGIDVSGLTVGAVINTSSAGCDSESEAEMLTFSTAPAGPVAKYGAEHRTELSGRLRKPRRTNRKYCRARGTGPCA